ncbi:MAG: hypothetical protein E7286_11700 [Lachnospiraceae bacterium]|nr:hypothetical protein [Lachnospiraceae bacterium]
MTKELLMAVDLGTSFIKAGVYDLNGSCVAEAKEPVLDERPAPGIFIQRGKELYASVIRCVQSITAELGHRAGDVEAISFTGQMAGFMGVDENWQDVTGWSCSLDTRYAPYADRQLRELKEEFLEISGTNSPLFSAKYQWFRDAFPSEEKRIAKYLMISSYIIGKLGDRGIEEAVIDGSLITWTGLADVKNRKWSQEICDRLEVDQSRLPRITESTEVVAHLSAEAARLTGLREGIALVSGAGDKITGCVGAANLRKGGLLYEAASFGGISFLVDDYRPDYEKRHFDLLNGCRKGDLYAHYYMPGSGLTMDWFLQNFVGRNRSLGEMYREMDEKLATVPAGSEGLMAVGMLSGTVMPFDPALKGVWLGHTLAHRPEHFYRALGESFGYALAGAIERMEACYPEWRPDHMRIIGGGARSERMTQLLADVLGKPIETVDREDNALLGACILAAKGIGIIGDMADFAEEHVRVRRIYVPDRCNHEKYQTLKEQYQRCLQTVAPYFAEQM